MNRATIQHVNLIKMQVAHIQNKWTREVLRFFRKLVWLDSSKKSYRISLSRNPRGSIMLQVEKDFETILILPITLLR